MQVGRSFGSAYTAMGTNRATVAPWGMSHREFMDSHFAHHLLVFMFGEDLPIRENAVTLDPSATDSSSASIASTTSPRPWVPPRRRTPASCHPRRRGT